MITDMVMVRTKAFLKERKQKTFTNYQTIPQIYGIIKTIGEYL